MKTLTRVRCGVIAATISTLVHGVASAGGPPGFAGDGGGTINHVAYADRPQCEVVDLTWKDTYPKSAMAGALRKLSQTNPGPNPGPGPGVVYATDPILPGARSSKQILSATANRYCVQPFIVNTSDSPSHKNLQIFFTRTDPTSGVTHDVPLTTARAASTPRSATLALSIPGRGTTVIQEAWCVDLSDQAAKGLSLFLNVPAQNLLELVGPRDNKSGGSLTNADQSKAGSATNRLGATASKPDAKLPTLIQQYSTACKLTFPESSATDGNTPAPVPTPRVVTPSAWTVPIKPAYLPFTVQISPPRPPAEVEKK